MGFKLTKIHIKNFHLLTKHHNKRIISSKITKQKQRLYNISMQQCFHPALQY